MEKTKKYKDKIFVVIVITILVYIKQYLLYNFPIVAHYGLVEDDALMVRLAKSITQRQWLGEYSYNTLMKGVMFPKILSIISSMKISYIFSMTALYTVACIIFMIAIKDMIKNKYSFVGIFAILLFNPIMFSREIIQRVYRNALIPPLGLLITASFIAIYLRRNKKIRYLLPWIVIESISLSVFYYTREDSMWIVPFLIFMIIAFGFGLIIKNKKVDWQILLKIVLIIIPIISMKLVGNYIAYKNEMFYGLKVTNVLNKSNFTHAMRAIYAVKPNDEIEYVTVPKEKVTRMADISPSFAYISPVLMDFMSGYSMIDRNPTDNEVEDGWFFWALRASVNKIGLKTLTEEQQIYGNIANELNKAMDEGILERQAVMPSALIPPWRKGNMIKLLKAITQSIRFVATYDSIEIDHTVESEYLPENYQAVKNFEELTNDRAIYPKDAVDMEGKPIKELETQKEYIQSLNSKTIILRGFIKLYSYLGVILGILGLTFYIKLTIDMVRELLNKQFDIFEKWIVISGILGAYFTLIIGVAYNHIASCHSITDLYLAGAYPLYLAFTCICINSGINQKQYTVMIKKMKTRG